MHRPSTGLRTEKLTPGRATGRARAAWESGLRHVPRQHGDAAGGDGARRSASAELTEGRLHVDPVAQRGFRAGTEFPHEYDAGPVTADARGLGSAVARGRAALDVGGHLLAEHDRDRVLPMFDREPV